MTQVLPAALVAPTRASQSVGFLIRAVDGTTIATAFTTTGVTEVSATGYYRVNGGISAPDDGGTLEWYLNNAGSPGTFLSAVAIEPAPNQADQAAGIRAALGLASDNLDTQLSTISSKTTNLPATFPVVDGSGRVTVGTNADKTGYSLTQAFPSNFSSLAITASTGQVTVGTNNDKTGYSLASSQTFSTTGSVGSVTGAVGSVTSPVTAGTVSDKTGYSLSSSQTFNLTGNITGNLSGSVGSVTGAVGSVTGAVGSVTGAVGSVTEAVTVGTLNSNVITAGSIASGAITNAKFAAGAIDAAAIATDAITAAKIADNAIDAGSIASGAITNAKFAAGAISATVVADNTITDTKIASGAITNTKFAAGAVDATAIATDAITATKIADNAIDGGALATNAIDKIQANLATQASLDTKASQASVDALPTAPTIADAVWDEALSGHTIAGSTGKKLADTSTLTVGDIPAGLTAQQVWEYATRALTGTQATNLANISNIPTNPLLTNDARLNNLDATISSRSTLTAAQIRTELATELARLDVAVSTRLATAGYTTPPTTSQIAAAVEAALLNDADGQKLLEAIKDTVQALFDAQADVPVSTLVSLIAAQITADHGFGSYTTANLSAVALEASVQAIKAKTDNLPSDPADQSELVTLINTRLAAANYVAPNNTGILTAIGSLPSASTIADAVWDEALSGHLTAGSTGAKLNLASTLTVGDIPAGLTAQQVWEYATRTLTTASGLTTEQNTRLNELWRKAGLDLDTPVVRTLNLATGNVTETLGATTITHTETNSGNTVTTARQP